MSKMFDYISGKDQSPETLAAASLEHALGYLGVEIEENHKLRGLLREARDLQDQWKAWPLSLREKIDDAIR